MPKKKPSKKKLSSKKKKTSKKKLTTRTKKAASKLKSSKPSKTQKTAKATKAVKTTKKVSATKAPKAEKQAVKDERPVISLTGPFKLFMEIWNPKTESFVTGIKKLFTEYMVPGKTDKQREENAAEIIEKIESSMRKEPFPQDIEELLEERFSKDRIRQLSAIFAIKPKTTIRLNTLKADLEGFSSSKVAADLKVKRTRYSPWCFEVQSKQNPTEHPIYARGLFEIEDEASQLISLLLNARPGQRVLDMCAREGDHTLGIGAMMKNKGSLFVYDADPQKLRILKQKTARAGIDNIRILGDNQIGEVKGLDAILIDAPSSGTGLLARQPEIKWRYRKEELPKIQKVQAALLREGARKLKLGGRLIYATSSLSLSENEQQIEHFLKASHNSFRLIPAGEYLREYVIPFVRNFYNFEISEQDLASFLEFNPYFFISPDIHGCNGAFAAVIERTRIST